MKTTENSQPIKTKLHKGMFVFYCACGLLLLMAFGLMIFRMVLNNELKDKLNKIRTAGYPATLAELNDYYPAVPDEENAALLYEKAFNKIQHVASKSFKRKTSITNIDKFKKSIPFYDYNHPPLLGKPLSREAITNSQIFVNVNCEVIELLKAASRLPKCRFTHEFAPLSWECSFSESPSSYAMELFAIFTILNIEPGNKKQLTENILILLKMSRMMTNRPTMQDYMLKFHATKKAIFCLEYVLSMIELDSVSLQKITDALEANLVELDGLTERALIGDRVIELNSNESYIIHRSNKLYQFAKLLGIITLSKLKILNLYKKCINLDKNDFEKIKRLSMRFKAQRNKLSLIYIALRGTVINPYKLFYTNLRIKAHIQATIIGLSIKRYQLKYHTLPVKLTQLVPGFIKKLPNDPFTGKPFRYVKGNIELCIDSENAENYPRCYRKSSCLFIKRPGWVVYSFGRDLDNDKGIPMGVLATGYHNGDIPFRCVRKGKHRLKLRLKSKLAKIRAAGYPTNIAELNDYYPLVLEKENAAKIYQQAFQQFHNISDNIFKAKQNNNKISKRIKQNIFGDRNRPLKSKAPFSEPIPFKKLVIISGSASKPILGKRLSKASKTASRKFIVANYESIKLLKFATTFPKCRFPIDFSKIFTNGLNHLMQLRDSIRLFSTATILAAERGNKKQVVENILTMFKICHALDNEPLAISYSIKVSMQSLTIETIEYALSLIAFDDNSLLKISNALEANLDKNDKLLNYVFAGEQVFGLNFTPRADLNTEEFKQKGTLTLSKINIIDLYQNLFALDKSNIKKIKQHIYIEKQNKKSNFIGALIKELTSFQNNLIYKKLTLDAKIKATIIGLTIERYQLKCHKLPEKLTQLVPEFIKKLPNDPFTGKTFCYRIGDIELPLNRKVKNRYFDSYKHNKIVYHSGDPVYFIKQPGWVVYSLGEDQDDDNGMPREYFFDGNYDIPFRCVRKEK